MTIMQLIQLKYLAVRSGPYNGRLLKTAGRMDDPVPDSSDEFGEREPKANFLRCTGDGKIDIEQRFRAGNEHRDTKVCLAPRARTVL